MASPMSRVNSLVSADIGNYLTNVQTWGGILYNVKAYGANGDGTTNDTADIAAAIAAADDAGGIVFFPAGTYITDDLTSPINVTLWFANGAKLSINSGKTVTINGMIDAGLYQIFTGSGTVAGDIKNVDIYAEWFGALADGVNNDSTALQKAINLGRVRLSEGNYNIYSSALSTTAELFLVGSGRDKTKITFDGADITALTLSSIITTWGIRDLTFQHNGASTPTAGAAININGSYNGWIENVFIIGSYHGLITSNCQANKYRNVDIWLFKGFGMYFSGGNNDHFISDCFINGQTSGSIAGPGTGIRILNKAEALMFDCVEIILCDYAMSTDAGVDTFGIRPAYCRFSNVFFDSSTNGVLIDKAYNFHFEKCWFSNRPNHGIVINTGDDIIFDQCSFINSAQHGCLVQSAVKRIKFTACSFVSNSTATANTYNGLIIAANTTDFIVQGCTFTNGLGFPGLQAVGVTVNAGTSDRYIIADNLVTGNATGGVSDGGTGVNKRVADNY